VTTEHMSHGTNKTTEPRPLTDAEHALLRWLLTRGAEITGTDADLAASFLPQLGALRVAGCCACGCQTVDLAVAGPDLEVPGVTATLADVEGLSPEGTEIGVILRASDGTLSEMELYPRDGRVPFTIPGEEYLQEYR
jgi:hypothetical protein